MFDQHNTTSRRACDVAHLQSTQSSFKRKRRWRAQTDGLVARCATIHEATSDGGAHSRMHDTRLLDWAGYLKGHRNGVCMMPRMLSIYVSPVAQSMGRFGELGGRIADVRGFLDGSSRTVG
jgi:hypothetical protein